MLFRSTVSQAGLVNPVFGKFQTTSTGGVLLARIAKTGGAFSAKIYVSAPSLLGGELFLAVAVSSAGVVTSKLITKESGVGIDASLVASYVTSGDYVELYITRGCVMLTVDVIYTDNCSLVIANGNAAPATATPITRT